MLDVKKIRKMFPIYDKHPELVYLDSAASSLKPLVVLDKMNEYYKEYGVNIHRGAYSLSYKASEEFDCARSKVAKFINALDEEIVFTSSTTDSLNKFALMFAKTNLKPGDVVLTTELEHHSSLLPWLNLSEEIGFSLEYVELNDEAKITVENFKKSLHSKVKLVAITYVSNVLGYVTPVKEIIKLAHEAGALVIVDAAQAISHIKVDVKDLDCDFLAASAHKMFGPTGVGILYGKKAELAKLKPVFYGGDMNTFVTKTSVDIKDSPYCFEAGTPMIAEVIGFGSAVDFINEISYLEIGRYLDSLREYLLEKIKDIKGIKVYNLNMETPILSFNIEGVHPHDAATCFDTFGISLRAGHHCAQLVSTKLGCPGSLRASFHIYNTFADIDKLVDAINKTVELFKGLV